MQFTLQNLKDISQKHIANTLFIGACVDSRLYQQGMLFFALTGEQSDGHLFLEEVYKKGCTHAVVQKDYKGLNFGLNLIYVEDPLKALQDLSHSLLNTFNPKIIAITGSVGKTTTKDFVVTLLKDKFKVAFSPGNSNSQIGLPLSIINHTKGDEEIVVLEMGMSSKGDISKLIAIAPPTYAIITTVALVHAYYFDSLKEIALAKAEILAHPKTKTCFLYDKTPHLDLIEKIGSCKKEYFSENNLNNALISKFSVTGDHNKANLSAAVKIASYLGLSDAEITKAIEKLKLPDLRNQRIEKDGFIFINDAYNAAPISVIAALKNIPTPMNAGKKIAVLADMAELGKFSKESHVTVGKEALSLVDLLLCYGNEAVHFVDEWQKKNKPYFWFKEKKDLILKLKEVLKKDDVVLIKGSKSTKISTLIDELNL